MFALEGFNYLLEFFHDDILDHHIVNQFLESWLVLFILPIALGPSSQERFFNAPFQFLHAIRISEVLREVERASGSVLVCVLDPLGPLSFTRLLMILGSCCAGVFWVQVLGHVLHE